MNEKIQNKKHQKFRKKITGVVVATVIIGLFCLNDNSETITNFGSIIRTSSANMVSNQKAKLANAAKITIDKMNPNYNSDSSNYDEDKWFQNQHIDMTFNSFEEFENYACIKDMKGTYGYAMCNFVAYTYLRDKDVSTIEYLKYIQEILNSQRIADEIKKAQNSTFKITFTPEFFKKEIPRDFNKGINYLKDVCFAPIYRDKFIKSLFKISDSYMKTILNGASGACMYGASFLLETNNKENHKLAKKMLQLACSEYGAEEACYFLKNNEL